MGAGAGGLSQHLDNAEEKLQWISKIPCFAPLSHDTLLALAAQVTVLNYSKGEYIIEQGQVGSLFGILVQGVVQISAIGPSGAAVILCSQYRGFYFGEAAIVGNTTTTATITASEDCIVFGLRSHELQRLAVTNPAIKESLLQILSYRLKQNLLSIPFFAKLQSQLERKKEFKMMGAFDLLSTLFEVESIDNKQTIFNVNDIGDKFYVICEGCVRISSIDGDGNDFMLSMLKKNDVFGEIALLEHTKRTATARAFEPVLLLSITKTKFDRLFEVFPDFEKILKPFVATRTANTLNKVKAFTKLSRDKLEILGALMEFEHYDDGEVIEHEGQMDASVYVIVQGAVEAQTMSTVLSVTEGGGVVGEMALLTGTARTATLTSRGHSQLLILPGEKFRRFLPFAPEIMDDLIKLGQSRRKRSVEVNAENSLVIPDIDNDIDNKLYLYSLLRNHHDAVIYSGPASNAGSDVNTVLKVNDELRIINQRKRVRIDELRNRMRQLTNQIEHGGMGTIDIMLTMQTAGSKPKQTSVESEAKTTTPVHQMKRRKSWTSNTEYEQHKEDIVRILRDTFRQKLESLKKEDFEENQTEESKAREEGGHKSLGNTPKAAQRKRSLKNQYREDEKLIDISLDGGNSNARLNSPTKQLGTQIGDYSAIASSRHILEEAGQGGGHNRGSRPSTAERERGEGGDRGSRPGSATNRKFRNSGA